MQYKSSQIEESEKRVRISGNSRKVEGKIRVRKYIRKVTTAGHNVEYGKNNYQLRFPLAILNCFK